MSCKPIFSLFCMCTTESLFSTHPWVFHFFKYFRDWYTKDVQWSCRGLFGCRNTTGFGGSPSCLTFTAVEFFWLSNSQQSKFRELLQNLGNRKDVFRNLKFTFPNRNIHFLLSFRSKHEKRMLPFFCLFNKCTAKSQIQINKKLFLSPQCRYKATLAWNIFFVKLNKKGERREGGKVKSVSKWAWCHHNRWAQL